MNIKSCVSVIIIFFNVEEFIQESIESILTQNHSNWEILLVDDGSTDDSTEIALSYAMRYPDKIRYLQHEGHKNLGMSAARNLGIQHAKGEYISFLDADDVWIPNTLDDQIALLQAHPEAAMVYGPIQFWYGWTNNPEDLQRDFVENYKFATNTLFNPPTLFLALLQCQVSISGMLVQRKAIERVGGFEEAFRGLYEDQVFSSKICLQFPVFAASQCWYKYRRHPNSATRSAKQAQARTARRAYLKWVKSYLLSQGIQDPEIWKAFRQEVLQSSEIWHYAHLFGLQVGRQVVPRQIRSSLKAIVGRSLNSLLLIRSSFSQRMP